jgi:hypothetical protein
MIVTWVMLEREQRAESRELYRRNSLGSTASLCSTFRVIRVMRDFRVIRVIVITLEGSTSTLLFWRACVV